MWPWEKHYAQGYMDGKRDGEREKKVSIPASWRDEEYKQIFHFKPLSPEQTEDIKAMVNSEQYEAFATLWRNIAYGLYADARKFSDTRTYHFNATGSLILEKMAELETYRNRKPEEVPNDPYDV